MVEQVVSRSKSYGEQAAQTMTTKLPVSVESQLYEERRYKKRGYYRPRRPW